MPTVPSPSPPYAVPPPPLPSMPQVDSVLSNYLSQFSLWAQRTFSRKLSTDVAISGILLQANDAAPGAIPKVFMLQVNTAGTLVTIPVALGSGRP